MAVLGIILFPFIGSLFLYSVGLFSWAVVRDFRRQRRAFFMFAIAIIGILLAYGIATWRERPISSAVTYSVVFVASASLRYLSKRLPNQSSEPTLSSGTSPAVQKPRLP
jgi:multisubunit Na+/H+ antiporter MnhB subunit